MADLISRAAAIAQIKENYCDWCDHTDLCQSCETRDCIATIEQHVPAVDAAPVVHGRWIGYPECLGYDGAYHDEHIVCSKCHSVWNIIDNDTERFDYCPACGAKMDKEDA